MVLCDSPQLSVQLIMLKDNIYVEEFAHFSSVVAISSIWTARVASVKLNPLPVKHIGISQ